MAAKKPSPLLTYSDALYKLADGEIALSVLNDNGASKLEKKKALDDIKKLQATLISSAQRSFPSRISHDKLATVKAKQHKVCFKEDDVDAEKLRLLKTLAGDTEYMAMSIGQLPENIGNDFSTSADQASATLQVADHLGNAIVDRSVAKLRSKALKSGVAFNEQSAYDKVNRSRKRKFKPQHWIHEVCRFRDPKAVGLEGKPQETKTFYKKYGSNPVLSVMRTLEETAKKKAPAEGAFLMIEKVPAHGSAAFLEAYYGRMGYSKVPDKFSYSTHHSMKKTGHLIGTTQRKKSTQKKSPAKLPKSRIVTRSKSRKTTGGRRSRKTRNKTRKAYGRRSRKTRNKTRKGPRRKSTGRRNHRR